MLGKTFKGLTDAMLAWQTERLLELEASREGHVVHVRPGARRRDRARRRADELAVPGRRRAAVRAREGLSAGQVARTRPTRSTPFARSTPASSGLEPGPTCRRCARPRPRRPERVRRELVVAELDLRVEAREHAVAGARRVPRCAVGTGCDDDVVLDLAHRHVVAEDPDPEGVPDLVVVDLAHGHLGHRDRA